ncbi:hypothetical protein HK102_009570, partial [Quaeritorhiza haematococci]
MLNKLIEKASSANTSIPSIPKLRSSSSSSIPSGSGSAGTAVAGESSVNAIAMSVLAASKRGDGLGDLDIESWSVEEINQLLSTLLDKRRQLESAEKEVEVQLLADFLRMAKEKKEQELIKLQQQLECLSQDLSYVNTQANSLVSSRKQSRRGRGMVVTKSASGGEKEGSAPGSPLEVPDGGGGSEEKSGRKRMREDMEVDSVATKNATFDSEPADMCTFPPAKKLARDLQHSPEQAKSSVSDNTSDSITTTLSTAGAAAPGSGTGGAGSVEGAGAGTGGGSGNGSGSVGSGFRFRVDPKQQERVHLHFEDLQQSYFEWRLG